MRIKIFYTIACAVAIAACGGGGSGDSDVDESTTSPEGVYVGKLSGSPTSTDFQMLILENNEVWSLYGIQSTASFGVLGFVQGSGTVGSGDTYTSPSAKDFGFSPGQNVAVNATYNSTTKTITGSTSSSVSFSGGASGASLYSYSTAASLASTTGIWQLTSQAGEAISATFAPSGTFTATGSSGCTFGGTIAPRASGKNVFNLALTFGASPCALPGQTATGIALAYPLTTGQTQLILLGYDSTRTYGLWAFGAR
jgi:hypothetical protein